MQCVQYVAVCCSVLHCVAVCCSVLQCQWRLIRRLGLHVLWCAAVCLQRVAVPMPSYQPRLRLRVPYAKVRAKNRHIFAAVGGQVRGLHNLQRRHMVHEGFVFVKFVEIGNPAVEADAVCCSVLRCDAVCCSMLQCDAVSKALQQLELIQRVSLCCGELQCVAVCCSVLQCVAVSMAPQRF